MQVARGNRNVVNTVAINAIGTRPCSGIPGMILAGRRQTQRMSCEEVSEEWRVGRLFKGHDDHHLGQDQHWHLGAQKADLRVHICQPNV